MTRSTKSTLVAGILIATILAFLPIPANAQQTDETAVIQWRGHTIDTREAAPTYARQLTLDTAQAMRDGYYFLQFTGPITRAMKAQVVEEGVRLLTYVPQNTYIVYMPPTIRQRVQALPFIKWVGIYQPAMRLSKRLLKRLERPLDPPPPKRPSELLRPESPTGPPGADGNRIALSVMVFKGAAFDTVKRAVEAVGGQILFAREGKRRSKIRVVISRDMLLDIARIAGVMWIEESVPNELHNNESRDTLNVAPVWNVHGLRGDGQIVAISDTGLDSGVNDATMHDDFEGRIQNIFSWPVQNLNYICGGFLCVPGNVGADDGASDQDSGHGTHTTGSAVGDGTMSGGTFSGVAPNATIIFQALEQFLDFAGTDHDKYRLGGIPPDNKDLYQEAYDAGARIHSNSWGAAVDGEYTDNSFEADEFVWDNPDMLIIRTAGNSGWDGDENSVIDTGSLGAPGSAKNVLTIGSSENNRAAIPMTWASYYGAGIDTDRQADDINGMAAFSSRGPANADTVAVADDRIKPDLVAPGSMVVSTRTQFSADTVWFNDDMEAGVNGWTAGGAWTQIVADSHTATTSWHDSPAGDYADNTDISLASPTLNLSGGGLGAKSIQFWARFDLGAGDEVRVQVSKDGGTTYPLELSYERQQADWELHTIGLANIPDYGNSTTFRLRFRLVSDNDGNTGDGFFVDDVRIVEGAFSTARLSDAGLAVEGSADDQNYLLMNGTSMSAPLTAGAAALARQYFTQELGINYVSAALLRATLINGATDISPGQYGVGATREIQERPNNVEGWGRVNIENSLFPAAPAVLDHMDELAGLETGDSHDYQLTITDAGAPIVVTMVYHDAPGAALVNNLDMTILTPGGTTEFPNGLAATDPRNNVEQIVIAAPVVGAYTIRVHGQLINDGPQPYAIVTSAGGTLVRRDPVDVALALDLSGSMLSPACPTCDSKLDVLKDAVELFVALWTALTVPDDRIGLNYFRTTISEFEDGGAYLLPVIPTADALITDVRAQATVSANLTAMGGSLQTAIGRLTDATRPRNIILFTDGMQNVNPMVIDTDPSAAGVDLVIDDEPGRSGSGVSPTSPPTALDTALGTKINTIGVGATPAFSDLLETIADETEGVSKLTTAPDVDLRRFYVEELVDALRHHSPQLLDYRHGNLVGAARTETFTINHSARKVLLKLSWKRGQNVSFRTIKDGVDLSKFGQIIRGDYYRIHVLDVPFTANDRTIDAAGDWQMQIRGTDKARFEAAVIVDETELEYDFSIAGSDQIAGNPLNLEVTITADGQPLINADKVTARVLKPNEGIGNLLSRASTPSYATLMTTTAATAAPALEPTAATPGQRKLLALQRNQAFYDKMQPVARTVTLTHAGGGRYTGQFADTTVPGIYTVVYTVSGDHPGVGQYQRTEVRSKLVRFGTANADASKMALRYLSDPSGRWNAVVSLRPMDRHGNFLGPDYGNAIAVTIASPGKASTTRRDLADGTYEIEALIPTGTDPTITIHVMDKPLYSGPVSKLGKASPYSASLHYGYTIPTGSFDTDYNGSHALAIDLGYRLDPNWSVVGLIGYNGFESGRTGVDDTYWWNISANVRYEMPIISWKPYTQGGLGVYIPESGDSAVGINIGVGVEYQLDSNWHLDLGVHYHHAFSSGTDPEFVLPNIGVIYRF